MTPKDLRSFWVNFPDSPSAGVASTEKLWLYFSEYPFAVVLAGQGYEAFRKADESDTESALVDYRFYCRAWIKAFRAYP